MSASKRKRKGGAARDRELERRKALRGGILEGGLLGTPPADPDRFRYRKMTASRRRFLERLGLFVPAARTTSSVTIAYTP